MIEYVAEPKSRAEIRSITMAFRKFLHLNNKVYFPIVELLDIFCELWDDFSYEIVDDSTFPPNVHADTDVLRHHIRIKQSVYEGAVSGNGRDRMTIAHEVAHYFLMCFCGFSFQRNFTEKKIPAYCSPEWQAKCFAGELLIPFDLTKDMSPSEIAECCGVSVAAASYQYMIMHDRKGVVSNED
ncbi:MAG: ImmA/IrrE family metallo-endopeptidase [Lachnospiraceae bacterium]